MPIISKDNNPSLSRIAREGFDVLSIHEAEHQDIRELHIGFLNMMPDAAFFATERQFFRLTAASTNIVQIHIHPIKCDGVQRSDEINQHIAQHYRAFDELKVEGLDAMIVTGANPQFTDLTKESYWPHATEIFDWAENNVCSVFYSCLASHAVLQAQYGLTRTPLNKKLWGIYSHTVTDKKHPLVSNINTRFDMPHSRGNDIEETRLVGESLKILATGRDSGVALATSKDGFRQIFCQGHPEYDTSSLLKEYKREINNFIHKTRPDYPPLPHGYVNTELKEILTVFQEQLLDSSVGIEDFPDDIVDSYLENTWRDTAKAIFSNWLGLVYRITNVERTIPFMDGIDPNAPLAKWEK